MERYRSIWVILAAVGISFVIVAGSLTHTALQGASEGTGNSAEASTTAEPGYVMRIDGTQIALYREGSETPYAHLDMPLTLLSEQDLATLETGITVPTEQELRRLVEDISS